MKRLILSLFIAALLSVGAAALVAPAHAATHPTCRNNGSGGLEGYDYAGFASTTLIPKGSYDQADFADLGSSLDPADTNQGGHVALWISTGDGAVPLPGHPDYGKWIQTGVTYTTWSTSNADGTWNSSGPFSTQTFIYIQIHDAIAPYEHLYLWPVSSSTYYTAKISRDATDGQKYTASIGGHSMTKTFGAVTFVTNMLKGENLQNTWSSPEPCNIADMAFQNATGQAKKLVNGGTQDPGSTYEATQATKFDMLYATGSSPLGVFESPWNVPDCIPPGPCLPTG